MRRSLYLFAILLFLTSSLAFAQHPNFSGIWKVNFAQSDYGPQPAPKEAQYIIRQVGSEFAFNYIQDGHTARIDITPDDEERVTSQTGQTAIWTRVHWSGDVLIFESRERKRYGTQENTGLGWTSRWTLSPDGQQLVMEKVLHSGDETGKQRLVFDKQPLNKSEKSGSEAK